jgi:hypothetical protein
MDVGIFVDFDWKNSAKPAQNVLIARENSAKEAENSSRSPANSPLSGNAARILAENRRPERASVCFMLAIAS